MVLIYGLAIHTTFIPPLPLLRLPPASPLPCLHSFTCLLPCPYPRTLFFTCLLPPLCLAQAYVAPPMRPGIVGWYPEWSNIWVGYGVKPYGF